MARRYSLRLEFQFVLETMQGDKTPERMVCIPTRSARGSVPFWTREPRSSPKTWSWLSMSTGIQYTESSSPTHYDMFAPFCQCLSLRFRQEFGQSSFSAY